MRKPTPSEVELSLAKVDELVPQIKALFEGLEPGPNPLHYAVLMGSLNVVAAQTMVDVADQHYGGRTLTDALNFNAWLSDGIERMADGLESAIAEILRQKAMEAAKAEGMSPLNMADLVAKVSAALAGQRFNARGGR